MEHMEEVKHQPAPSSCHPQPAGRQGDPGGGGGGGCGTRVKHRWYSPAFMMCSGGEESFKVLPGDQQCVTQKQTHAVLKRRNWLICLPT